MVELIKMAVVAFEAVGVAVLIFGFVFFMGHFIPPIFRVTERHEAFREFRQGFGRTLLLALAGLTPNRRRAGVAPGAFGFRTKPGAF